MIITLDLSDWRVYVSLITILALLIAWSAVGIACWIQHLGRPKDLEDSGDAKLPANEPFPAPHGSRFSPSADPGIGRHRRPGRLDPEIPEDDPPPEADQGQR